MNQKMTSKFEALDATMEQLLQTLKNTDEEKLNTSPSAGAWSALQVLNHVKMVEFYTISYCQKKINAKDLKKAGLGSSLRLLGLKGYLISPLKFPAPGPVNTENLPAKDTLDNIHQQWITQRKAMLTFLDALSEEQTQLAVYKHPAAGRFSFPDMLEFLQTHFDHHKKQVFRTLKAVG